MSDTIGYPKLPLEQIFQTKRVRVIDHLITMKGLGFTFSELQRILKMNPKDISDSLYHLEKFGLVELIDKKYILAENPRTLALHKFMHESVVYNLDQIERSQTKQKEGREA